MSSPVLVCSSSTRFVSQRGGRLPLMVRQSASGGMLDDENKFNSCSTLQTCISPPLSIGPRGWRKLFRARVSLKFQKILRHRHSIAAPPDDGCARAFIAHPARRDWPPFIENANTSWCPLNLHICNTT